MCGPCENVMPHKFIALCEERCTDNQKCCRVEYYNTGQKYDAYFRGSR